ncbi:MAG: hypothetical protein ABL891_11340 [Burkholderiales bacterium]
MKHAISFVWLIGLLGLSAAGVVMAQGAGRTQQAAAFSFGDAKYFHRYTINDQHEYTPAGQEDLKAWADMVTINVYPKAKDGDALAATANSVLGTYKAHKGVIVNTNSIPRTNSKPAEHLVVAVLGRPAFLEAVFARFKMHEGTGIAVIYSHRIYGKGVGDQMSEWLKQRGPATEKALLQWNAVPKLPGK